MNFYELLNVSKHASRDDIRKQFLSLSKSLHTDKKSHTGHLFSAVKEAYDTLSNDKRRREYDLQLENSLSAPSSSAFNSVNDFGFNDFNESGFRGFDGVVPFQGSRGMRPFAFEPFEPFEKFFNTYSDADLARQSKNGFVRVRESHSVNGDERSSERVFINGRQRK